MAARATRLAQSNPSAMRTPPGPVAAFARSARAQPTLAASSYAAREHSAAHAC